MQSAWLNSFVLEKNGKENQTSAKWLLVTDDSSPIWCFAPCKCLSVGVADRRTAWQWLPTNPSFFHHHSSPKDRFDFFPLLFVWGAFIHGCITPALQLHKCSQKVTLSHHRQRGSELASHSSPDSHKHSVFSPEWTANNSLIDQIGLLFTRGSDWSTYSMYWMTHWPS